MALEQPIEETVIVKPAVLLKIEQVIVRFMEQDSYATAIYSLLNDDNVPVTTQPIGLTEAELSGWEADDQFVVDLIKTKLNLS
jgi:hypothetical protein